jgi:shikimate kinase / 3-dehydroquinate synthase
MTPQRPIAVSGFMGAGKTTVGQRLARRLGWPFVDLDDEISAAFGHPIPQIFELYGEAEFRAMEARLLRQAVALPRRVVALGGGAVLDGASRDVLRERSRWVHLEVPPGELLRRLGPRDDSRPLWSAEKLLLRLAERGPAYAEAPEQVDGDAPPGDVVDSLMAGMSAGAPAEQSEPITLRRVPVNVPGAEYEVHIGWGLLRRLGSLVAPIGQGPIALLSDWNVSALYGDRVEAALLETGRQVLRVTLPAGEQHKAIAPVLEAVDRLLSRGWQRGAPVVALGGGVLGDMAGLVASLTLRGVPFVQVPTTLLAMVDSSVGGKVGVNHRTGKNLLGAFHQPRLVVADLETLQTLPDRELRAGLGEAAKTALLGDTRLLELLELRGDAALGRDRDVLAEIVERCVRLKAQVVAEDEREADRRRILNLGHTLGHALERARGYGTLLHGEAVAIGMVAAAELSVDHIGADPDFPDRVRSLVRGLGLPIAAPNAPDRVLLRALSGDKKLQKGVLPWVLLKEVGCPTVCPLPLGNASEWLATFVERGILTAAGE